MSDNLTPSQRKTCMSNIHGTNTKPELLLRRGLWGLGFRYRINERYLPGSPDIVFPKYRSVIFVNGCFWHGHKDCKYYTVPKTNTDFWVAKVARNKERDQEVWRKLEAKGWYVIIVWECQLKKGRIDETVERVASEIVENGKTYRKEQVERRMARKEYRKDQKERKAKACNLMNELKTSFEYSTR